MRKKIQLKDGRQVSVRTLTVEDKDGIYDMFQSMSDEALRWGMPPYTRDVISRWMRDIDSLVPIGAEDGDRIVGFATLHILSHPRRHRNSDLGIYIHQDYHDVGLGTAMMGILMEMAREHGLHKINLEVVADNEVAVRLYEKHGFAVEGKIRDAFYGSDERYHDTFMMGFILEPKVTS